MVEHVELTYRGKLVTADSYAGPVTTVGVAPATSPRWHVMLDGVTRDGFEGRPDDTEDSVRATLGWWLVARDDDPVVPYRGYQIRPTPYQLWDSDGWTIDGQIWKDRGTEVAARLFSARNTFATREDAVLRSVEFGQRIIDGEVASVTVADL